MLQKSENIAFSTLRPMQMNEGAYKRTEKLLDQIVSQIQNSRERHIQLSSGIVAVRALFGREMPLPLALSHKMSGLAVANDGKLTLEQHWIMEERISNTVTECVPRWC